MNGSLRLAWNDARSNKAKVGHRNISLVCSAVCHMAITFTTNKKNYALLGYIIGTDVEIAGDGKGWVVLEFGRAVAGNILHKLRVGTGAGKSWGCI